MWESMNEAGVYKCPYSMRPEVYTTKQLIYIRCKGHEDHKMYLAEGNNVIKQFCSGDYTSCNHYKKYEEDKQMSKIKK